MPRPYASIVFAGLLFFPVLSVNSLAAQTRPAIAPAVAAASGPTYADLADLADRAPLVARVELRDVVRLEPEQAPDVRPGTARVFVKARTRAVLVGQALGESVSYLADVPLTAKGKLVRRTPGFRHLLASKSTKQKRRASRDKLVDESHAGPLKRCLPFGL